MNVSFYFIVNFQQLNRSSHQNTNINISYRSTYANVPSTIGTDEHFAAGKNFEWGTKKASLAYGETASCFKLLSEKNLFLLKIQSF